jgi:hypothetical protein
MRASILVLGPLLAMTSLAALAMALARQERSVTFVLAALGIPAVLLWLGRPANAGGPPITGYQLGAELLNFGASIAFMGVNASAFVHYFVRGERRTLGNFLPPLLGFA